MNQYNDKGEPHGYWEDGIKKVNYLNGIKHGKYENYWDTNYKKIFCRGNYHMNRRINLWEWYKMDGKTLYRKDFCL